MEKTATKTEVQAALDELARLLAVRDHSLLELRGKLAARFNQESIDQALAQAQTKRWLQSEDEIAARAALTFQRKLKSRAYIENQLLRRGLPLPPQDHEMEQATARKLVEKKFGPVENLGFEERESAMRYLGNRGFDEHTIRMVLNAE